MTRSPRDIIDLQKELKAHTWHVVLWPQQWKSYKSTRTLSWEIQRLDRSRKRKIPQKPGIYSLLVQPGIAEHPHASVLMYIGKAEDLQDRFYDYCTSERAIRPKVMHLLGLLDGFVHFCYAEIPKSQLSAVEYELIACFVPSCNSQFPGELRKAVRAF